MTSMTGVYNLEPQPTASAIIHTTQGEIALELFAKQTPLTCRNFLQLSLDGYYDGIIFHRLIPGFILQGGDPTGTGHGGKCIYDCGAFGGDFDPWPMEQRKGKNGGPVGTNFKDEFHTRLKFNRRGLLGMANEGVSDSNGSQFFFTLGKAQELNGKNTLFGRVAGNTVYNLAEMGEAEITDGTERPVYPVKITQIEILVNPFEDMKKRERTARSQAEQVVPPAKKRQLKRKTGKQLLSFGDEGDWNEGPAKPTKVRIDRRIAMEVEDTEIREEPVVKKKPVEEAVPVRERPRKASQLNSGPSKAEVKMGPAKEAHKRTCTDKSSPEPEPRKKKSLLEQTNEEIAAIKASMKRTIHASSGEPIKEKKKSAFEQLIPESSMRGRKVRPGENKDDLETLNFLKAFRSKLEQTPAEKSERPRQLTSKNGDVKDKDADEDDKVCDLHFIAGCQSCQTWHAQEKEESDDEGWMAHTLSCVADKLGKDLKYRKKAEEELVVIDPLERARTLKEEKRARVARAGESGR